MAFQRIHVELTNRCNFSCSFCPDGTMARPRQDMDLSVLDKALEEIAREKLSDTVYFHLMGEALLHPQIVQAVRNAKSKNLKVSLTTNGWGFSPGLLAEVLDAGVDEILFSVQTPLKKTFGLRRSTLHFDEYKERLIGSMAQAVAHGGCNVIFSLLTTPASFLFLPTRRYRIIDQKKELVESFLEWTRAVLKDPRLCELAQKISQAKPTLAERIEDFKMTGWNKLELTPKFSLETRVLGDWVHRGLTDEGVTKAVIGACDGLKTHMGILSNGDLVFCCVDYDGKTRFGNINDTSIKDALQSPMVKDVQEGFKRLMIRHPYCKRCLGDVGFFKSLARQVGSIVYFKLYRPLWERRRNRKGQASL